MKVHGKWQELKGWLLKKGVEAYWNMPMASMEVLVQASRPQQAQHLSLLVRSHASKHHSILQDCFQDRQVLLLQQVLKGSTSHSTLSLTLSYVCQCSESFSVLPDIPMAKKEAEAVTLQVEVLGPLQLQTGRQRRRGVQRAGDLQS